MGQLSPLFARQPIFDRQLEVIAYELLFRSCEGTDPADLDGDQVSSHVLFYAFGDRQLADVIGGHQAYINFTRNLLVAPPPLPPTQLVIEVLEDVEADEAVIEGLKQLKKSGYQIALDDFFLTEHTRALLEFADIVKIDVLALSGDELERTIAYLRDRPVKLLAEKVETYEMLERCKRRGFDYFQGYFLSHPQIIEGVALSDHKRAILELLVPLTDPMANFDEVLNIITADKPLCGQILKLVDPATVGLRGQFHSVEQAVATIGLPPIRNWAIFLILVRNDRKPRELWALSLARAKWCEQLGHRLYGPTVADTAFTTGILSNLDAYLDTPMSELVDRLRLPGSVASALRDCSGKSGSLLHLALLHEQGRWQEMDWDALREHGLTENELTGIYTTALGWAERMLCKL